jgi:predicted secreted protein
MAVTKFLARDLTIEVLDDDDVTWLPIGGLNSLTHSPATSRADTTDFDSNGRAEHIVAQRGESWALAGFALEDVATGDRDAGQARVEALGQAVGLGATGSFRITSPGGNTATFDGSVEVTLAGGGHNDAAAWQAALEISGDVVYA